MQPLNELEKAMYDFIGDTIKRDGYSPTVRDIREALEIKSTSTVHKYLQSLEDKGYIQRVQGKSRTLRTEEDAKANRNSINVPIIGRVAAGMPILAIENHEGYIDFPTMGKQYLPNDLFALRVRGESMIEAGILSGDIIIVEKTPVAQNGEIVVALVGDEATVKTFYKEDGHFRLQPENSTMEPIIVDEVYVLGKVISSMRFYK
ncbi:MAG: transcriptional repressor LexA [Clostridia bacterium]|nr:transcriptional repressor LexA [Clostridia bacterium]